MVIVSSLSAEETERRVQCEGDEASRVLSDPSPGHMHGTLRWLWVPQFQNWVFTLADVMFVLKIRNGHEEMKCCPYGYDLLQLVFRVD